MSNYDLTGGWNPYVAHEGNRCPINPELHIEYQIEHGDLLDAVAKDAPWGLRHGIGPSIIGFRVVKKEYQNTALSQDIGLVTCSIPEQTQLSRREYFWLESYKGLLMSGNDESWARTCADAALNHFDNLFGAK